MTSPTEILLSPAEVREYLTSDLDNLSGAEAHEVFSERLDDFLEQNGIDESDIISGHSEYAPILSKAVFNGLDFSGLKGTGLSLADARYMLTDPAYRMEMADKFLTGNEEKRIESEHSEPYYDASDPQFDPHHPDFDPRLPRTIVEVVAPPAREAYGEAIRTKEFMHYELRDALNSGTNGLPATLDDFEQNRDGPIWKPMLGDQAAFHQNGGKDDLKFVHPDGREVVYDGDTKELITSDEHMGTYNYANATIPNDPTPGPLEAYLNTRTEGSRLHVSYDVDTWIEMGSTRAERYADGGAEARQAKFDKAVRDGVGNSIGNTVDEIRDAIPNAGEAIDGFAREMTESFEDLTGQPSHRNSIEDADPYSAPPRNGFRDFLGLPPDIGKSFGAGPWREGALNPSYQTMGGAHIQSASLSETALPSGSVTVTLEDAMGMLAADQKTLNASATGEQASPVQDALNHPDAAKMFQNLHSHGVTTLTAEITPDMSPENRSRELLLGGRQATHDAGIPMPSEQRELDVAQQTNNSCEDDHSVSV